MNEIISDFSSNNLFPGELILNGKIQRFEAGDHDKKKSGWYLGFQNHTRKTGEVFYVVVYGNYKTGEDFKFMSHGAKLSPEDRAALKQQIKKATEIAEATRLRHQDEVSHDMQAKWDALPLDGVSPYLIRKQISECKNLGIRFADKGNHFYVPMVDVDGKLWSSQAITDTEKKFFPGGRVKGCFHVLGEIQLSHTVYLAEGFATAASIYLATGKPTVVTFTAENLILVSSELRRVYKDKDFIVCGDDDRWTCKQDGTPYNPGRECGERAAKSCLGTLLFPKFQSLETKPTDFNDLHLLEGLDAVKLQICEKEKPKIFLAALGFKEKEYFFTSSANQQIVGVTKFSTADFLNLLPMEYWESVYPGAGAAKVDWTAATSSLMEQSRARGIFQTKNIRGAGVWSDEGRIVVNMGDHLIVDGRVCALNAIKSRFFYTLGITLPPLHPAPLSADECDTFIHACAKFKWLKSDFGFLCAGAIVTARICGALPVRPHTWLTGAAANGKSTLFNRLIVPMLGEPVVNVIGGTSEAGVRQTVKTDAVPVIFDEFETNGPGSAEKIEGCVELMRAAWSDSSAYIVKGGSNGNATAFQVKFAAIVSSIRVNLKNDADRGRFAVLELAPHGSDKEHWEKLSRILDKIDIEYGNRLFARTISMIPILLSNYKVLKSALSQKVSQRFGDQYGMLLAGYSILLHDEPMTKLQAEALVNHVHLSDEREDAKISDQDECATTFLTKKIKVQEGDGSYEMSISECISRASNHFVDEALQLVGIKVKLDKVSIAVRHSELENLAFKGSRWSNAWANSLSRIPGAEKNKVVWIAGRGTKCVVVPVQGLGL